MRNTRQAVAFLAATALAVAACGGDSTPTQPTGTPNLRPTAAFSADVSEGAATTRSSL